MNARLSSIMRLLEAWNDLQSERVRLLRIHQRAMAAGLVGIRAMVERRVDRIDEMQAALTPTRSASGSEAGR